MPRGGAVVLADLRNPTLSIVCEPCGRRGTYIVVRLMEQQGDAKLTDLLQTLANCPKARSGRIHDRCKAVFEGLAVQSRRTRKPLSTGGNAQSNSQAILTSLRQSTIPR